MINKKIISAVCAAAMTASAFTALIAFAEDALWSDTFNAQETGVLVNGTAGGASSTVIEGLTIAEHGRGGDGDIARIREKEDASDKYLTLYIERFCDSATRYAKATFDTTYAPASDSELVMDFELKMADGTDSGNDTAWHDSALRIAGTAGVMSVLRSAHQGEIPNDTWVHARLVINASSGAKLYIGDSTTPIASEANLKDLKEIRLYADAQYKGNHPAISFDDVVIYTAADGLSSTAPDPKTQGAQEQTYTYAPKGEVPDGYNTVVNNDLNNISISRYIITANGSESEYTDIKGLILKTGAGDADRGESKWEGVLSAEASLDNPDRYIVASNGAGSTANRGPKLQFSYNEIAERENVYVQFATRLHANGANPAEVIFSGDLVASASKGNIASPLAMITTDATADSAVYSVDNSLKRVADGGTNVLEVNDNEWVLVTIQATRSKDKMAQAKISVTSNVGEEDEDTVYIFGDAESYADLKDSTKSGISTLPYISFRSGNDADYGVSGTKNDIDNVIVATTKEIAAEAPVVSKVELNADKTVATLTTNGAEGKAIIVKAAYSDGRLTGVKSVEEPLEADKTSYDVTLDSAAAAGEKVIVITKSTDGKAISFGANHVDVQ